MLHLRMKIFLTILTVLNWFKAMRPLDSSAQSTPKEGEKSKKDFHGFISVSGQSFVLNIPLPCSLSGPATPPPLGEWRYCSDCL